MCQTLAMETAILKKKLVTWPQAQKDKMHITNSYLLSYRKVSYQLSEECPFVPILILHRSPTE